MFWFFYIFFALAMIILTTIVLSAMRRNGEAKKNDSAPVVQTPARLVSRRFRELKEDFAPGYYLTFETADGPLPEFSVSAQTYAAVREGDSGLLTYQRKRFLGFTPQPEQDGQSLAEEYPQQGRQEQTGQF